MNKLIKKITAGILAATTTVTLCSCSKETAESIVSEVSKAVVADGRDYGKVEEYSADAEGYVQTQFFKFKVNSSYIAYDVDGYIPNNEGFTHLGVNVNLVNTTDDSIPIGTYDFTLKWGDGGEDEITYALDDEFTTGQYPIDTSLASGASASGYVYFIVPDDVTDFSFEYLEIYEDDFEGNTFAIKVSNPEVLNTADDYVADESFIGEDNRYTAAVGENLKTTTVDLTVNSSAAMYEVNGYVPDDENYTHLVVNVTVANPTDTVAEISVYDYLVTWGLGESDYNYALDDEFTDNIYPVLSELQPGESFTGDLYFIVPSNISNFTVGYVEIIGDVEDEDSIVNAYTVDLTVTASNDTAAGTEAV